MNLPADKMPFIIHALSSCAIEGNTFASGLLRLKDKDPEAFIAKLKEIGWLDDNKLDFSDRGE